MPVPALQVVTSPAADVETDVLVLAVAYVDDAPRLLAVEGVALSDAALPAIGVTGKRDQVVRLPAPEGVAAASLALVGLGVAEPDAESLRYAAGTLTRQLRGASSIAFALPSVDREGALALLEGAGIGAYSYDEYRVSSRSATSLPAAQITLVTSATLDGADEVIARAEASATAMATVRDLVNMPPNDLYPASFAEQVAVLAEGADVEITVWDETRLAEEGFGGILGVGSGSSRPPRLVKLSYSPEGATQHVALVGKGITFDSGGLSLKPAGSMIGMKYDMTGAASVLAVTLAAARLELPVRVTAWMCLAENMPSGSAARPNDVFRIRGGKTVENLNTDAEGRLVLADGLVAAGEEEPDAIVDIATLTGAAKVALGTRYVGAMGNGALVARVRAAAEKSGELVWHMPLAGEMRALLNSDVADIANVRPGNTAGGMLIAGVFLKEFVPTRADGSEIPWLHLDIAGTADNSGSFFGFTGKGSTGTMVRSLLALVEDFAVTEAPEAR